MSDQEIAEGDWVQIWARVASQTQVHPEDLRVKVDSHNASPEARFVVRRDWVTKPGTLPEFAEQCTHLYREDSGSLLRCLLHQGHGGLHKGSEGVSVFDPLTWDSRHTYGYIEEA